MIIDSHCHLHDPAFEDTRGAVARATEHHVWGVVAVGCDPDTNRRTIEAADALYGVTVGDDSVSRVISLRLDEAQAIADRRRGESLAEVS